MASTLIQLLKLHLHNSIEATEGQKSSRYWKWCPAMLGKRSTSGLHIKLDKLDLEIIS